MGIRIVSTGRALPKKAVSNEELSTYVDTDDEWIFTRTGIKSRYLCIDEDCVSLACEAADSAIKKSGLELRDIGIVIVATTTNDRAFPSVACMIQSRLGLSEDIVAFDISAACSGFLFALETAYGFLSGMKTKYALVVGCERLSRIIDYNDRNSCILFGDGGGAAVVTLEEGEFIYKSWCRGNEYVLSCPGVGTDRARLAMDGREVFKFAVNALSQAIDEVLKRAGKDIEDIDAIVCHQANARIINNVKRKYDGQASKFYINIERYANTSAASIPIALDEMFEKGMLEKGMEVLCVGFGAGLTWNGAIINI